MQRIQRQAPFLRAVLREADANKRKQYLQLANADQVNAVSERPERPQRQCTALSLHH